MDVFANELSHALSQFDYVLFDMGAGLSKDQLPFILSAEDILIITTPEPTAIMDAYSAVKHLVLTENKLSMKVAVNRCRDQKEGLDALPASPVQFICFWMFRFSLPVPFLTM